ncbi:MAG: hypothetical protein H7Y02_14215 [Candidatus Obscuribacterales bacterium]|nr:hypothetical protein [Steroidobacteraceae bacterium]
MQHRRSDFDVTNTVQVSSPEAVRRAVVDLFSQQWPKHSFTQLDTAFRDFERLFTGKFPRHFGCDTVYHDMQHSLDGTLASARIIVGHERSRPAVEQLGAERAVLGIVTALFHDAGYIRREDDAEQRNGAEFTLNHVSRSAQFLADFLPSIDMTEWVPVATRIVHFTGYEMQFEQIILNDARDRRVGHIVGTGDLIAQMSDRCYLEKCRDRLYPEFVLGGIALSRDATTGQPRVKYSSGLDVLRQTPDFYNQILASRLDGEFGGAYRYVEALYDGNNPYLDAIERSLAYLQDILGSGQWPMLRRDPPCFTWEKDPVQNVRTLVLGHLKEVWVKR